MFGALDVRMMMLFAAMATSPQAAVEAKAVQASGGAYGLVDEVAAVAIVAGVILALFLFDKFSWRFLTGRKDKR